MALIRIVINPEARVSVSRVSRPPVLVRGASTPVEIEIVNQAKVRSRLRVTSPSGVPAPGKPDPWLEFALPDLSPLSGRPREIRVLNLRASVLGQREAVLAFDVGHGTQDLGFRSEVALLLRIRERP